MRILLLTQFFEPEPAFKGLLFAQELQRLGHEVEVLTGFPNYPGGKLYPGYRVRLAQREVIDGVRVLRVPLYPSHDKSALRRSWNYASFALSASIGIFGVRRPDITYVYHPPASIGLPAILMKWLRGVPFIYDIQDLWPETLVATGMVPRGPLLGIIRRWMQSVYRGAAHIVVLSRGFRGALMEAGVPEQRITIIRNWANEASADAPDSGKDTGSSGPFAVMFAGTFGLGQVLHNVLLSARQLQDRKADIRFHFVGSGVDEARLRAMAEELGLANVDFLGWRRPEDMGPILASADALLVHLRDHPLYSITIPSKTQAYMRAGRPILMGVRGDAADLVEEAGAGIAFTPESPDALTGAIERMQALTPEARRAMGDNGRRYYRERLSLQAGAADFARLFEAKRYSWRLAFPIKRAADAVSAAIALIILALPMAAIGLIVALRLGRPIMFRQERPGRDGVPFHMVKFRTMTDARDADGRLLPDRDRLTRLGRILRATSLDELPELFNVLRGEMSLVGPRPLLMRYTAHFTEEERLRLALRPGITGLAQVSGRNLVSWDARLALDVRYVRGWSLWLDIRILARTVLSVFNRGGVVVDPVSVMRDLDEERSV